MSNIKSILSNNKNPINKSDPTIESNKLLQLPEFKHMHRAQKM